jgi:macrodomain Ter protein organizer (MatP/YcbG family)
MNYSISLPDAVWRKLKAVAALEGKQISEMLAEIIEDSEKIKKLINKRK